MFNIKNDPLSDTIRREITGFAEPENADKMISIMEVIKEDPRGVTISQLSDTLEINRNTIRKYAMVLAAAGYIEARSCGHTKIYNISKRIPAITVIENIFEGLFVLNFNDEVIYYNKSMKKIIDEIIPDSKITTEEKISTLVAGNEIGIQISESRKKIFNESDSDNISILMMPSNGYTAKIIPSVNLEGEPITLVMMIKSLNENIGPEIQREYQAL
ncbi:winged helix-turn-helix domain-containing protein [Methanoplanus endosymbiosus]|uniref:Winged helix-turn-helix domain-containing protein n=1 Tax=Methanoplanus endosymbiosus TaxID=33865 RepID=A0A9E7PNI2_9EURY|nr:winged helix-turn-helix domain-containing protein [Methanoplanus endosymbiosus]UUX93560.1 winged helix-turn-helix domain-containing protein [Methanoplanus endosymbiosus]